MTLAKIPTIVVAGAIFALAALAQSAAADPVYQLGPGSYAGGPIGTFIIPSVAQGLLFYLDPNGPPTEITLTGLGSNFGEKVQCVAVTPSTFACSVEGGAVQAPDGDGQRGRQVDSQGSVGNGLLGQAPNGNGPNGGDPTTDLVNGSGGDPASLFQTADLGNDWPSQTTYLGNDSPLGPASVPEPGSLALLASAFLIFSVATRRFRRS